MYKHIFTFTLLSAIAGTGWTIADRFSTPAALAFGLGFVVAVLPLIVLALRNSVGHSPRLRGEMEGGPPPGAHIYYMPQYMPPPAQAAHSSPPDPDDE